MLALLRAACPLAPAIDFARDEMKLYNSIGPNPKVVRIFMAEKGIELPKVEVDIRGGENRRRPYLEKNPSGQCPALELDDGRP
jgi:glutathione S-transferase